MKKFLLLLFSLLSLMCVSTAYAQTSVIGVTPNTPSITSPSGDLCSNLTVTLQTSSSYVDGRQTPNQCRARCIEQCQACQTTTPGSPSCDYYCGPNINSSPCAATCNYTLVSYTYVWEYNINNEQQTFPNPNYQQCRANCIASCQACHTATPNSPTCDYYCNDTPTSCYAGCPEFLRPAETVWRSLGSRTGNNSFSFIPDGTLPYNANIRFRVRVTTSHGQTSNSSGSTGPYVFYAPAPTVASPTPATTTSPTCPGWNDGTITVNHPSITAGQTYVYTIMQWTPKVNPTDACTPPVVDPPATAPPPPSWATQPVGYCPGWLSNAENAVPPGGPTSANTSFLLHNGNMLDNRFKFKAGKYSIKIEAKSAQGRSCIRVIENIDITDPAPVSVSLFGSNPTRPPSCKDGTDGVAFLRKANGVGGFTYKVYPFGSSTALSTATITASGNNISAENIPPGDDYTFEVTDVGCSRTATVTFDVANNTTPLGLSTDTDTADTKTAITCYSNLNGKGYWTVNVVSPKPSSNTGYKYTLYKGSTADAANTVSGQVDVTDDVVRKFDNLGLSSYLVSVVAPNGCTNTITQTFTLPDSLRGTFQIIPACESRSNAKVIFTKTAGTGGSPTNLSFAVNGQTKTFTASGNVFTSEDLAPAFTTIPIRITDNCLVNNEASIRSVKGIWSTIGQNDSLDFDDFETNIAKNQVFNLSCFGDRIAKEIVFANGRPPYTVSVLKDGSAYSIFNYTPPSGTEITFPSLRANNTPAGNYRVTISDNCVDNISRTFQVFTPTEITATLVPTNLTCNGNKSGIIEVRNLTGGVPGPGSDGNKNYDVRLYSYINSTKTEITGKRGNCANPNDENCVRFTGLDEDVEYRIEATDFNPNGSCTKEIGRRTLTSPDILGVRPHIVTDFSGHVEYPLATGNIYAQCKYDSGISYNPKVNGGTAPYTFHIAKEGTSTWPQPYASVASGGNFTGLGAGNYRIDVSDRNGCPSTSEVFQIREAVSPMEVANISAFVYAHGANTRCYDENSGRITVGVSGGVGNYTYGLVSELLPDGTRHSYTATRPEASHTFNNLHAINSNGDTITYTIAANDALGCPWSMENGPSELFRLAPPDTLEFSWSVISRTEPGHEIPCRGDGATVRIKSEGGHYPHIATVTGGGLPAQGISLRIDTAGGYADFTLPAGTYTAIVEDGLLCNTALQTIILRQPATHVVTSITNVSFPVCIGNNNGEIEVSATGGIQASSGQEYLFVIKRSNATIFDTDTLRGPHVTFLRPANYFDSLQYEVMSIDAHQCTHTIPVTMPVNPAPLTLTYDTLASPSCYGGTDGFITVTASNHDFIGGTSLRFRISGGHYGAMIKDTVVNSNTVTFENLEGTDLNASAYEVWVEDANVCLDTAYQYLEDLQLPSYAPIDFNLVNWVRPSCHNGTDASLLLKATGGVPPYRYSNDNINFVNVNADSLVPIINLASGNHDFFLIDSQHNPEQQACLSDTTFFVEPGRFINLQTRVTHVRCAGGEDGAIDLTPALDNMDSTEIFDHNRFTFHWVYNNISSDTLSKLEDISALRAGKYTVHAAYDVDSLVCVNQRSVTVMQPVNGVFRISNVQAYDASCGGNINDGRAIITVTGGWPDSLSYYRIDSGSWILLNGTTFLVPRLSPGTHRVEVKQVSVCTDIKNFEIGSSSLSISSSLIAPSCPGNDDGTVILTATEPNIEFAYTGHAFQSSGVFSYVTNGLYYFVARRINEHTCLSDTLAVEVNDRDSCQHGDIFLRIAGQFPATCSNAQDGQAAVHAQGGVPPYRYFWNGVERNSSVDDLAPGAHKVIVTDKVNASDTVSVFIDILPPMRVEAFTSKAFCPGSCNGGSEVSVFDGSGKYKISWQDDVLVTGFERNGLCPGQYNFTVKDSTNEVCTIAGSVTIEQYERLSIAMKNAVAPTCPGGTDGYILTEITGGSNNFTLSWINTPDTDERLNGYMPGSYVLSVTDRILGCTLEDTLTLPDAIPITVQSKNAIPPKCHGGNDGEIQLTLSNVSSPLIRWNHNSNLLGPKATGLRAGTYRFSVTGANGCTIYDTATIVDRAALQVTPAASMPPCFGNCNGSGELAIDGGTKPYTIRWDHGPRTPSLINLCARSYTYTVTDKFSCTVRDQLTITTPEPLTILQESLINPTCAGFSNGRLSVAVSGGIQAYSYRWSNGETSEDISGLPANNYMVTVTDQNLCTSTASFTLTAPAQLLLVNDIITPPSCALSADGRIIANPVGGTRPYAYVWDDFGATSATRQGLAAGTYRVTVTDTLGCTADKTYILLAPAALEIVNIQITDPICFNDRNGNISLETIGGTSPYAYQWNNGQTVANPVALGSGEHGIIITDENGCTLSASYTLNNPPPPVITGIPATLTLCTGSTTAIAPDGNWTRYWWSGPADFASTSPRIEASLPGDYSLTAWDTKGCPGHTSFAIEISDNALTADFLRISEAVAFEPIVFVDISIPAPQSVEWIVPDDFDVVVSKRSALNIELLFTRADTFEIGMIASMGTCQSELYKTVVITEPNSSRNNGGERLAFGDEESPDVRAYPNPAGDELTLQISVPLRDKIELWLISAIENREYINNILEGQLDYYVKWDVSKLTPGMYYLVYQQNNNTYSQRIAVIR